MNVFFVTQGWRNIQFLFMLELCIVEKRRLHNRRL